jgi:regulatory protein
MPPRSGPARLEARRARLERHAAEEDPHVVLAAAARFLEVRQRSVDEVRRHLAEARYPADLIGSAIDRLVELGMLDDRAFARAWLESRDSARPRGEQALRRELTLKGLDRETIAAALADRAAGHGPIGGSVGSAVAGPETEGEPVEMRAATALLRRRGAALARIADARTRRQRAYALLARSGFDPEVCRAVSAHLSESDGGSVTSSEPSAD